MPDEDQRANEPILEVGISEGGNKGASVLLVVSIIVTVLFTGFLVFWSYRLNSIAKDRAAALLSLQEELKSKQNTEIENKAASISSAVSILSTASKSKYLFRVFIDDLTKKITNDTKLNSLSIDDSGKVSIDGESASYRSVADLTVALQTSEKLKDISITGLSQSSSNDNEKSQGKVIFSISAKILDWKLAIAEAQTGASATEASDGVTIPAIGGTGG